MLAEDRCATGGGCVHLLSAFTCRVDGSDVVLAEFPRNLVINLALGEHRTWRGSLTLAWRALGGSSADTGSGRGDEIHSPALSG